MSLNSVVFDASLGKEVDMFFLTEDGRMLYSYTPNNLAKCDSQVLSGYITAIFGLGHEILKSNILKNNIEWFTDKGFFRSQVSCFGDYLGFVLVHDVKPVDAGICARLDFLHEIILDSLQTNFSSELDAAVKGHMSPLHGVLDNFINDSIVRQKVEIYTGYLKSIIFTDFDCMVDPKGSKMFMQAYSISPPPYDVNVKVRSYLEGLFERNPPLINKINLPFRKDNPCFRDIVGFVNDKDKSVWDFYKIPLISVKQKII